MADRLDELRPGSYSQTLDRLMQLMGGNDLRPLMRLAGDVVPLYPGVVSESDAISRLIQPGVNAGAQGSLSINQMGPRRLDLLNILRYPGGGQMLPSPGRRSDLFDTMQLMNEIQRRRLGVPPPPRADMEFG